jgi:hypothetical protein
VPINQERRRKEKGKFFLKEKEEKIELKYAEFQNARITPVSLRR